MRIAFFKTGSFSHTNSHVAHQLRRKYPDAEVDVIDVWDNLVPPRRVDFAVAAVAAYPMSILRSPRSLSTRLHYTSYAFNSMRRKVRAAFSAKEYAFTFQTQSIFDLSLPGAPHFLYTDHTVQFQRHYPDFSPKDLPTARWLQHEREIYHAATLNLTMSRNISQSIVSDYQVPAERVSCIYAGSNIPFPEPSSLPRHRFTNKTVLFVGVEWGRKGGPALVSAFENVRKTIKDARLVIVGCSPAVGVPGASVIGRVPIETIPKYFRDASVFCMPSRREPFGISFVEAMAYGLPAIGCHVGAVPEIIKDGVSGYVIDVDDEAALSESLIQILSNPELAERMGRAGRAHADERYRWDLVGDRLYEAIENAI